MAKNNRPFFGVTNTLSGIQKEAREECHCKDVCCTDHKTRIENKISLKGFF